MKKKILFVNASLTGGGSEKVMTMLANIFCEKKYDVTMVLVKPKEEESYEVNKKVKIIKLNYKRKNKVFKLLERINKLKYIIKTNKYDYVISFMYDINISTILAVLGTKIHLIISERNDPSARKISVLRKKI